MQMGAGKPGELITGQPKHREIEGDGWQDDKAKRRVGGVGYFQGGRPGGLSGEVESAKSAEPFRCRNLGYVT